MMMTTTITALINGLLSEHRERTRSPGFLTVSLSILLDISVLLRAANGLEHVLKSLGVTRNTLCSVCFPSLVLVRLDRPGEHDWRARALVLEADG